MRRLRFAAAVVLWGAIAGRAADDAPPFRLTPGLADAVFGAIAARFGPVQLDPALKAARPKFARDSMSPSRLVDDETLWTRREGEGRTLEFGSDGGLPYRVGLRTTARPAAAGAYRGVIGLTRLGPSDFEWRVSEELGLGSASRGQIEGLLHAVLSSLERDGEAAVSGFIKDSLPRSASAMGRLYHLEGLRLVQAPGGGTAVTLEVRMDPAGIATRFPRYARFVETYLSTIRFGSALADAEGRPYAEVSAADLRLTVRLRIFEGALAPLSGPPRKMPDRLVATSRFSIKSGLVRVGIDRLASPVRLVRGPGELGFTVRFDREPDWQLPFLAKPILRASLRRPFEDGGAALDLLLRESPEGKTRIEREYRFRVKESWIIRWLGRFGGGMATVFRAGAEAEADRFDGECLWALRDDLVAYASRPGGGSRRD